MITNIVDRAIKECWLSSVPLDYKNLFLLLEDTFKNSFYYHLRTKLTDEFLQLHNLRIYTELYTQFGERIDLAIVRIDPLGDGFLRDNIIEHIAVCEFKYKGASVNSDPFYKDIEKTEKYILNNKYPNNRIITI